MLSAITAFFKRKWTFSDYFIVVGTIVALAVLFGTDPAAGLIQLAFGADVVARLSTLPTMVFGVGMLWLSTRALHDYLDMKKLAEKASETAQGAALVHVSVSISRVALAIVFIGLIGYFR